MEEKITREMRLLELPWMDGSMPVPNLSNGRMSGIPTVATLIVRLQERERGPSKALYRSRQR